MEYSAQVAPIAVEVPPSLLASSLLVDSWLCHFGEEGCFLINFHEQMPRIFRLQPSLSDASETQHSGSSLFGIWREVF
jgi:hypothetical protein